MAVNVRNGKFFCVFLVGLYLVGCGPSAEQIASQTAVAQTAIASNWTATPTATATATPTSTPTITPTPTPFAGGGLILFTYREIFTDFSTNAVYSVRPDGTELIKLADGYGGNLSPDKKRLVYLTFSGTQSYSIHMVDLTTSVSTTLYSISGYRIEFLDWTPDSTAIIFSTGNRTPRNAIYSLKADSGQVATIVTQKQNSALHLSLSPDGKTLAYSTFIERQLFLASIDGTEAKPIHTNDFVQSVAWSPDGKLIASVLIDPGSFEPTLAVMNLDGELLSKTSTRYSDYGTTISWSPDSRKIAYRQETGIWVLNADGSGSRRVSSSVAKSSDLGLAWTPDGHWLVFTAQDEAEAYKLYIVRDDGSELRQVLNMPGNAFFSSIDN